jgi:hypothetical protein
VPRKRRYLIAVLIVCAAVGVTFGLARPTGGSRYACGKVYYSNHAEQHYCERQEALPTEVKGVEKETEANGQEARMEGRLLGATDADWNAAHTMDDQYETGVAYDPTPGLSNGATDRFSSVIHSEDHVTSFYLAFPSNTSITQAVAETVAVLPRDATHGPVVTHAECATITIHSATLQAVLGSPDAEAFFGEGTSYDPAGVTGVELEAATPKALEGESGC